MAIDLEKLRRISKGNPRSSPVTKDGFYRAQRHVTHSEREYYERRVISIVSEILGLPKSSIGLHSSFIEDLLADSLDTLELVAELEDTFDIEIPDEAEEYITTVDLVVEYIMAYKESQ